MCAAAEVFVVSWVGDPHRQCYCLLLTEGQTLCMGLMPGNSEERYVRK